MSSKSLFYYLKRLHQMGLPTAIMLLYYRCKKAYFISCWRHKKKSFTPLTTKQSGPISVNILGFGSRTFSSAAVIDWHNDFFTNSSPTSWANQFFADITIPNDKQLTLFDDRAADIKLPWELSRLHYLHNLSVNEMLAILSAWMIANPFPYGVNWLNPMEVGIRAINIIAALEKHASDPAVSPAVMAQLQELLRYHALFIEHCWEVSAAPNNHYLADLVGYLHLCCFLDITKYYRLRRQCWEWIEKAFRQQLLADGTSYEHSTAYHRLVSELLDLALTCAKKHGLTPSKNLCEIQMNMHQFIADCTDQSGNFVLIGDNDSGIICPASAKKAVEITQVFSEKIYPDFGLTITRNKRCLLTQRHCIGAARRPTGHLHGDAHAITLSLDGIPLFIDPGTYLYTAHPAWRNALRAPSTHTTVAPAAQIDIAPGDDLFQFKQHDVSGISRVCKLTTQELILTDILEIPSSQTINWYWHLGPEIQAQALDAHTWLLLVQQKPIAQLHSPLPLAVQQSRASTTYGSYKTTTILCGSAKAKQGNKMTQQFRTVFVR